MTIWHGKQVFLTGHTGFKGSWLALWLAELGARVTGFALPPPTTPSLFAEARVAEVLHHIEGDIRDAAVLTAAMRAARPDVVIHMAAQPLVRQSYVEPVETYATNVMGTVHLLEAVRQTGGVRAVICVTSDKCYENREWIWPYRETDTMGGHDPYSSSKGCAELVIAAYRRSYFDPANVSAHGVSLASVRAGNVIGGGDWAADRLIPDIIRSMQAGKQPEIRSPDAIRPWQHVLDALGGYMQLTEAMLAGETALADSWNFGPSDEDTRPVRAIVDHLTALWGGSGGWLAPLRAQPHEAITLKLDCAKARLKLGWRPGIPLDTALASISEWHKAHDAGADARTITLEHIHRYGRAPAERGLGTRVTT